MALQHSPSIVTSGLVYCSDPANSRSYPGSGTSLYDISGSGYTGTITGTTYTSGINGYLAYNGTTDRVVTTFQPNYSNTTWEAWVYCYSNVSTYNMFMGDWLPYFGFYGGNSLYFSNTIGGAQQTIQTATNLSTNTWYHAAFTTAYNGSTTTSLIYTNGVQTASGTFSGQQGAPGTWFTIGDGNYSQWYPFSGRVGPVKIYNRTLSASEITQNFNAIRGRYGV